MLIYLKSPVWVANSVDPDQTPRSAASDLGLHCLLRPVRPNIFSIKMAFLLLCLIVYSLQVIILIEYVFHQCQINC